MDLHSYLLGPVCARAYRAIRMNVAQRLDQYNFTSTAWSLLGIIREARDGILLADVAVLLKVKPPLITLLTQKLSERGLIERLPHHKDKRAKLLVLTSKGERLMDEVEKEINIDLAYLLKGVSREDLATYKRILETVIVNEAEKQGNYAE